MPSRSTDDILWMPTPGTYAPARHRRPCRYRAFIPAPLSEMSVTLDAQVAGVVSDAENAIRLLNTSAQPALKPLARLLLRTESIASSKVEGLQVGVRELARAEARAETGGRIGPTAQEILANIDAMQVAVDQAATATPFTADEIVAIHTRLMAGALNAERIAGRVRDVQNWIGGNDHNPCGADFVPPPPEYVDALLADLCLAVEDEAYPPIVQAALAHVQFETIHPFVDGNGRTGRALVQVVLRRRALAPDLVPPISVVLANGREDYVAGLTRFRDGDVAGWIGQFAEAAASAAVLARGYLRRVEALQADWRELLREGANPRSDAAAWAVIDVLPAHPVITGPVAAVATGRGKANVYGAIEMLADAGVLVPLSASAKRNQSWEAAGLLELIAGLEAGRAPDA